MILWFCQLNLWTVCSLHPILVCKGYHEGGSKKWEKILFELFSERLSILESNSLLRYLRQGFEDQETGFLKENQSWAFQSGPDILKNSHWAIEQQVCLSKSINNLEQCNSSNKIYFVLFFWGCFDSAYTHFLSNWN